MFKTWLLLIAALITTAAHADTTRNLRPAELKGIRLWGVDSTITQFWNGLTFQCQPRFKNETRFELASIFVQFVVDEDGRRTYSSPPYEIKSFDNYCVPHTGSLLPMEKSDIVAPIRFPFKDALWNTHSTPHLEFVGARAFVKTDLHDAGHLFSYFVNTHDADVIQTFKKDPSLIKVKNTRGMTATLSAFAACGQNVVKYLLAHGGSTTPSAGGTTIMHMASVNPNPGIQDLALKLGGKVNERTKNGNAPIHKAIAMGVRNCWQWLLAHKANPDIPDARGMSPAYMAINEGQALAIQDLAKAGANKHARDKRGMGWMEYAVYNYYMFPTLQSLGFGVNDRDPKTWRTPIMLAASIGFQDSEIWLLQHGANPKTKDRQGHDAFYYATLSNTLRTDRFFREIVEKNSR